MTEQVNNMQRVGFARCVRCDFTTEGIYSFDEQDKALREHLNSSHPDWQSEQKRIPECYKPLYASLRKNNSGTILELTFMKIIEELGSAEAQRDALKADNERLRGKVDKLTAQLKQARSEAEEERKSTAVEERWKNSQGEDYGSY